MLEHTEFDSRVVKRHYVRLVHGERACSELHQSIIHSTNKRSPLSLTSVIIPAADAVVGAIFFTFGAQKR